MKKIIIACLALVLCAALTAPVYADVWIPPTDGGGYNEALTQLPHSGEAAEPLNVFLSNCVSTGLTDFDAGTDDDAVVSAVLKYLELHPDRYPGSVAAYTAADGTACMRIDAGAFEACANSLFGRSIRAEDCPGYADGSIYVTAADFGTPVQWVALAEFVEYLGAGGYHVYFRIYEIVGDVENPYALTDPDETEGLRDAGYGAVELTLCCSPDTTDFSVSDFSLDRMFCDADLPAVAENLPAEPEEAPAVTAPNVPSAEPETGTASASGGLTGKAVTILVIVVALLAVGAAAAIIVVWRKKR